MRNVKREILLAFWKVHVLHHAAKEPVVGLWLIRELRHHGYEVSPGTIYPLLKRMSNLGWLRQRIEPQGGLRARRHYAITPEGSKVLESLRGRLAELHREVMGTGSRRRSA